MIYLSLFKPGPSAIVPGPTLAENRPKPTKTKIYIFSFLIYVLVSKAGGPLYTYGSAIDAGSWRAGFAVVPMQDGVVAAWATGAVDTHRVATSTR